MFNEAGLRPPVLSDIKKDEEEEEDVEEEDDEEEDDEEDNYALACLGLVGNGNSRSYSSLLPTHLVRLWLRNLTSLAPPPPSSRRPPSPVPQDTVDSFPIGAPTSAESPTFPSLRLSFSRSAAKQSLKTSRIFAFRPDESFTLYPCDDHPHPSPFRNRLADNYPAVTETKELAIELLELEGSGSLSDGYRGLMRRRGGSTEGSFKVIVKITSPSAFKSQCHERFHAQKALARINNEARLYWEELAPLQGEVVPVHYGLWQVTRDCVVRKKGGIATEQTVYASVMEDVGRRLFDGEKDNVFGGLHGLRHHSDAHKKAALKLYYKLGLAGVYHGAPKHVHTRMGPDGKGRLIDFEKSMRSGNSEEWREIARQIEFPPEQWGQVSEEVLKEMKDGERGEKDTLL
ncbi:hypothetical protein IAT38_003843 [Cryptococcus sp. DSM 104549]